MGKELDHLRRVETAKEFRKRLGSVLLKGQQHRILEVDKKVEMKELNSLKDEKSQKEEEVERLVAPKKIAIEQLLKDKEEIAKRKTKNVVKKVKNYNEAKEIDKQINKLKKEIGAISNEHLAELEKKVGKKSREIDKITEKQMKIGAKVSDLQLLKEYSGPGPYAVCIDRAHVRFVQITTVDDFKDKYEIDLNEVLSFKLVDKKILEAFEATLKLSAELKIAPGEIMGAVEGKANLTLKLPKNVSAELDAYAKAYGKVVVSLSGIMMEVGANAEAKIAVNFSKYATFSAKAYASAKAGVYASLLGVAAIAEAEAGLEASGTISSPEFWGGCSLELSAKIATYGKAEAKAVAGLQKDGKIGAGAYAGVSVGVKGEIEGTFKFRGDAVGSIGAEIDVAIEVASAGAVASIDLTPGTLEDGMRVFAFGAEVKAALEFGASMSVKGTVKIGQKFIDKGIDALKEAVKNALKKLLSDELYQKLKAAKQEIDHYIKKVSDVKKQLKDNTINYLHKGLVKLQLDHNKAVELEFSRHNGKLEKYKQQVLDLMSQLETYGIKDLNKGDDELTDEEKTKIDNTLQDIINKVDNEDIKKLVKNRARKDIYKDLLKYSERYDRRIKKFNEYINNEYKVYSEKIEKHYVKAVNSVNEFQALVQASEKDKSKTRDLINKEIEKLNELVDTFNKIITTKDELMQSQNLHGEDTDLPGADTSEVEEVINSTFEYLRNRIHSLMDKIDDLRDDLK